MTISEAIKVLEAQRDQVGDVEVFTDCEHCGKSTAPTRIVIVKEKISGHLTGGKT